MSKLIESILDGDFESVVSSIVEEMDKLTDTAVLDLAEGYDQINEELSLSPTDHKVLAAFAKGEKAESKKLSTDGKTLHGNWMGGSSIAKHIDGKVHLRQVTSRSEQTVHRALKKKHVAKNDIAECVDTVYEETEQLEEGRRIVSTHEYRNHSAKVYKNPETGEHEVEFYKDGKHLKDATYYTDDKADAQGTAKHFISKATVDEQFEINELSLKTLNSYINKNVEDGYVVARQKGVTKAAYRTQGFSHKPGQTKGLMKRYTVDELKKKISEGATVELTEEQLDELSKKTLSGYIKGASVDMGEYLTLAAKHRQDAKNAPNEVSKAHRNDIADAHTKDAEKRVEGIKRAARKLAEEVTKKTVNESVDETSYGDLMELSEGVYVKADEARTPGQSANVQQEPYLRFENVDADGNYASSPEKRTHYSHGMSVFKFPSKKAYEYAKKMDRPLSELGEHEYHAVVHNHDSEPKYLVNGKEVSKPSEHHEFIKNRLKI